MIEARYEAEITLSDLESPYRLRLSGAGLSPLGGTHGSDMVKLAPHEGGTRLTYDYEAEISGKVAVVGGHMFEGVAKIVLHQSFESLGRQAGSRPVCKPGWIARLSVLLGAWQ